MEVELTAVDSSTENRRIVLNRLPVMIGQGPDAGIHLDDHLVSRHHCEINVNKGTLVVRDLGSMLGTFVNGLNVTTALLMPGDKLTVGVTSFLVDYERLARSYRPSHTETPRAAPEASEPVRVEADADSPRFLSRLLHRVSGLLVRKPR